MDNIAQSMRFSPTREVVCRNQKRELAIDGKRLKISVMLQSRGIYRNEPDLTEAPNPGLIAAITRLSMTGLELGQLVPPFG